MKRIATLLALLFLLNAPLTAGLFKDSVDLDDLSELDPVALETLRETEFDVFRAQVALAAAKAAERRAVGAAKAAGRVERAEDLDLKAALAEAKAAKANVKAGPDAASEDRKSAASAVIERAELDLMTAKKLVKWKEYEQETRQAEVSEAKAAMDLAESTRDVARVKLLIQHELPAAAKHDLSELESSLRKRQRERDKAIRVADEKRAKLATLQAEWEALAANNVQLEDEPLSD